MRKPLHDQAVLSWFEWTPVDFPQWQIRAAVAQDPLTFSGHTIDLAPTFQMQCQTWSVFGDAEPCLQMIDAIHGNSLFLQDANVE